MAGGGNAYNFLIVFTVALGSFTYGYNSSIVAGVFGLPSGWMKLSLLQYCLLTQYQRLLLLFQFESGGQGLGSHHRWYATVIFPLRSEQWTLTDESAANGLFAGGGMIGCGIIAWLADKIGRTRAIQIICALAVVTAAIQGGSVHIAMFLVGRFFNGVA